MYARERSTRGQMKLPAIAQRGEGEVRDALPDSRHVRSGPQRDDLVANTARRVPEGTRKGFGGQSARFGPNPFGGVILRAIHFVAKPGKAPALPWVLRLAAHPAKTTPHMARVRQSVPQGGSGESKLLSLASHKCSE